MRPEEVQQLHDWSKVLGMLKKELIEDLPHYGRDALFFQNDEITTGQLSNKTEIKIHLLTGQFLYFDNERGFSFHITQDGARKKLKEILEKFNLKIPDVPVSAVGLGNLGLFHSYAVRVKRTLELFRMRMQGHYTLVHLWPHNFDFSVEWFTDNRDEQIGTGISPGDQNYTDAYAYMNPYPFNDSITKLPLVLRSWHTAGWKGIKVEWAELSKLGEGAAANKLFELFQAAKRNFE